MDKEKLIKHHFWILLGLALVLIPVVLSGVWMGVAEATSKQSQLVESKKKSLTSAAPKGENYLAKQEQQRKELDDSKGTVWKVNADPQANLIRWPRALAHRDQLYFGEQRQAGPDDDDRTTFKRNDVYLAEFEELAQLVKPTELSGGWEKVLTYVKFGAKFPTNEDCWLALEDLCIQREMLECVREVNNLLARFWDETASAQKELNEYFKPTDDESVYRFTSQYWHLDLALRRPVEGKGNEITVRGRLTNMSHRRLNIARIDFLLSLFDPSKTEGRPAVLPVEGQFLGVGDSVEFKDKKIVGSAAKPKVYAVEQRLDARFVPVKRIEKIALGYNSHRTADKPLVTCAVTEEEKKKVPAVAESQDAGGGGATAAAVSQDRTTSGINRLRYLTVTKQVRRMPIGVVMVVDQAHVQDILRAFANSRLHFQTTQIHLARYRGQSGSTTTVAAPMPAPAALQGYPSGGQGATGNTGEDVNTNLVEVAVYGLASIYEKFPPKGEGTPPVGEAAKPVESAPSAGGGSGAPTGAPATPGTPNAPPPAAPPPSAPPGQSPTPNQPKIG